MAAAPDVGLTVEQAQAFVAAWQKASDDYLAKAAKKDELKAATTTSQDSIRDLRRSASDTLRFIKAFAENSSKPAAVYAKAQIPAPMPPGPPKPPGTPYDFRAALNPDGSVSLRWRCNNPTGSSGTIYNIRRRLSTQADFEFVGAVGTRKYTDFAIPPGTASVQYTVTGQRGAAAGLQSSPFMILFGYGGGGLTIASQYVADGGGDGGGNKAAA